MTIRSRSPLASVTTSAWPTVSLRPHMHALACESDDLPAPGLVRARGRRKKQPSHQAACSPAARAERRPAVACRGTYQANTILRVSVFRRSAQARSTTGSGAGCSCCSAAAPRWRRSTRRASWASRPSASRRPPSPAPLSSRLSRCEAVLHEFLNDEESMVTALAIRSLTAVHGRLHSLWSLLFTHLAGPRADLFWHVHCSGRNNRSSDSLKPRRGVKSALCSRAGAGCTGGRAVQQTPMSRRPRRHPSHLTDAAH